MGGKKKKMYTLREVSLLLRVPYHTISYWQKRFGIMPIKCTNRKFFFDQKAIEEFDWIKFLIKKEGYSTSGAKKRLVDIARKEKKGMWEKRDALLVIKKEVLELLEILNEEI
jgi:DNA-binding transcriptional MerR regulator|uniref:MerR family transcriptional regulator n=1 Tax=candidate division WOR-3 bacterium TaxID=2052148 RepID=A0A7C3YU49_UNCW3